MLRSHLSGLLVCLLLLPAACGRKAEPPKPAARPANFDEVAMRPLKEPIKPGLWIIEPLTEASIPYRPVFVGTISDSTTREVWVIVRAAGMPDYWVQPMASIRNDGMWICQPYIGLSDTKTGVRFEIRAVADPKSPLQPSLKLAQWPDARYQSNIVVVARQ